MISSDFSDISISSLAYVRTHHIFSNTNIVAKQFISMESAILPGLNMTEVDGCTLS